MAATLVSPQQAFARIGTRLGLLGDAHAGEASLAPLVSALCGIRGDRMEQVHLVLAARLPDYEPARLLTEIRDLHALSRTWGVRGQLMVVPTPELPEFLAAAGASPRWRRFLEEKTPLSPQARLRLLKRICPETVSREALREHFPDPSMRLFILREAAQSGQILWREGDGASARFVWAKTLLGRTIHPARDYHALVGRYLEGFGPLAAADLGGWLGVTVAAARQLMAKHRVVEVQIEGEAGTGFMRPADLEVLQATRKSAVRGFVVVPPGDPLGIAYKIRWRPDDSVDDAPGLAIHDGRLVGTWTLVRGEVAIAADDASVERKMVKAVRGMLDRAGIEAEIRSTV